VIWNLVKLRFKIFLLLIILLAGAGYYFRADLAMIYSDLSRRIALIGNNPFDSIDLLVNSASKEISIPPPLRAAKNETAANLTQEGTIDETNSQRRDNGLPALAENKKLDAAAMVKAQDMFAKQYFAHESPTGAGPSDLAEDVNYEYLAIGENLALGNFGDDAALVQAWMDSPGHRANILNKKYTEIGVAVLKGVYEGETTWIAVQEFGMPVSACPSVDAALKIQIDAFESQLGALSSEMTSQKEQLENIGKKNNSNFFTQKVEQYNQLVNQYNDLISKVKGMVDEYNAQVKAQNACVQ
jgi:uncharacterized protein YkwD